MDVCSVKLRMLHTTAPPVSVHFILANYYLSSLYQISKVTCHTKTAATHQKYIIIITLHAPT